MPSLSGTCTLDGSAISGAAVYLINTDDGAVEATATTDANGEYTFSSVPGGTYHVAAQYDDGSGTQYNAPSKPFITLESSVTVLDDYESGSPGDRYAWHPGDYEFTTTDPLEGTQSLRSTSSYARIAGTTTGLETPRGYQYEIRTSAEASGKWATLLATQNSSSDDPMNNCYLFTVDAANGEIGINRREASAYNLQDTHTGLTLSAGTEYRQQIDYDDTGVTDNIVYRLLDANGDPITDGSGNNAVATASDDVHTGGHLGMYSWDGSTRTRWDYVTQTSL